MRCQRSRVWSNAVFGLWAEVVSAAQFRCAANLHHSLRRLCQPVRAAVTVSNYWALFLIHLFFKSASFAHACREGSSYWKRAGKSDAKPPERREREGGRVLCKERAKRRNEWENKWITDGMWVSASRKISLWLPRQREVRVGSAPDITNYVRARAFEIIDMQKRKWVFVSICKWFNAIWF